RIEAPTFFLFVGGLGWRAPKGPSAAFFGVLGLALCLATTMTAEALRMKQNYERSSNWSRWGPYLPERQWGTIREDYSHSGTCWDYFTHDMARSRAYRWGEDGLCGGLTDHQCRLAFSVALWNGSDPILKERAFGLVNEEGNH